MNYCCREIQLLVLSFCDAHHILRHLSKRIMLYTPDSSPLSNLLHLSKVLHLAQWYSWMLH